MIKLKRLDGGEVVINVDLIEIIEAKPDTIVTLTTGQKFVVADTPDEIIQKTVKYKKTILTGQIKQPGSKDEE